VAMAAAQAKLIEERAYGPDGTLLHPQLLERYRHRLNVLQSYAADQHQYAPQLNAHFDLVLDAIAVARAELLRLHRTGQIDDRVLHELERDLDLEELAAISSKN